MNLIFRPHWFDMKRFCSSLVSSQAACCLPAGIIPKISKQIKFGNWYSLPRNSRCTQDDVVSFRQIHHWGIYCLSVFFKVVSFIWPLKITRSKGTPDPIKREGLWLQDETRSKNSVSIFLVYVNSFRGRNYMQVLRNNEVFPHFWKTGSCSGSFFSIFFDMASSSKV
jgi:hypothetical protein